MWDTFKRGYTGNLVVFTILLIIISIIFTIINNAFEFTRSLALISLLIGVFSSIIVFASLNNDSSEQKNAAANIEDCLVYIFIIQAIISIGSFVSPTIKEIVTHFQFEKDADLAEESYSGIRGLAMSGRLYFEFACTCGLITIFQCHRIIRDNRVSYSEIIGLLLIVICGFFAGRTSLVGFAIGFLYILLSNTEKQIKTKFLKQIFIIIGILIGVVIILLPSEIKEFIVDRLLPWVFDVFIKYAETGSTESSYSFNTLNEMYQEVQISDHEWFIGSGKYVEPSGSYYGSVDAGYLRQILYWGLVGSAISLIYTLKIFKFPLKVTKRNYNDHSFIITILVYTFIVHYKGDLLSIARFYYVVLYLYFLGLWTSYKSNHKNIQFQ